MSLLRETHPPVAPLPATIVSSATRAEGPSASLRVVQTSALLAAAALDGDDPGQIAQRFGELSGARVVLLAVDLSLPGSADPAGDLADPPAPEVTQLLAKIGKAGEVVMLGPTPGWATSRSCIAPLRASGQLLGFLVMYERPGRSIDNDLARSSLQHAAALCAMAMMRERRRGDLVNELRYDLVAGLLLRHRAARGDRSRWSKLLGLVPGSSYRVLYADVGDDQTDAGSPATSSDSHVLEALAHEIGMRAPRAISVLRDGELISLIPEPELVPEQRGASATSIAKDAVGKVRGQFSSVELAAGLGRARPAPAGIVESGSEARNALMVQHRFSLSVGLLSFEELGVYSLLYQVPDTAELRAFVERVLGRLIAYDRKRNADLLRTLRAILDHNGSLLNASRDIGVHVNTIAYRHDRITTITGLDLSRGDDRLMSYLALKIIDGLPLDGREALENPPPRARTA